jgi:hypothetical protein
VASAPAAVTARAGAQCFLEISGIGAPSGTQRERNGDSYDCGQGEKQNSGVNGDALLSRQVRRKDCGKYLYCPSRNQNTQYTSSEGKHKRLSEKLLNESAAACSERRTHSQFFAAGGRARYE